MAPNGSFVVMYEGLSRKFTHLLPLITGGIIQKGSFRKRQFTKVLRERKSKIIISFGVFGIDTVSSYDFVDCLTKGLCKKYAQLGRKKNKTVFSCKLTLYFQTR